MAKKNLGGRPKKYTDEYLEALAERFEAWMEKPDSIYYKRFCYEEDIHPALLADLAAQNERFNLAYEKSKTWQEMKLAEGGLTNKYNAGFTKFMMGNICHGWTDRQIIVRESIADPLPKECRNTSSDLVNES